MPRIVCNIFPGTARLFSGIILKLIVINDAGHINCDALRMIGKPARSDRTAFLEGLEVF